MRVLMFGWEFPPHLSGGLGTACLGITEHLSKMDMDITFVLPKTKDQYPGAPVNIVGSEMLNGDSKEGNIKEAFVHFDIQEEIDNFVKKYEVHSSLMPYMNEESYKEFIENEKQHGSKNFSSSVVVPDLHGDYAGDLFSEVARYSMIGKYLVEKETFDIIHAHDWMTFTAAIEAKKRSGLPLVVHIHSTEFDRSGDNGSSAIIEIERQGMEFADHIIAVSKRTKGLICDKYGISADKVTVIYNSTAESVKSRSELREDIFKSKSNPFINDQIVLFLGRLTMQKGPEYFLKAASLVLKKRTNVRFVMAGSGDMGKKLIEAAADLKVVDRFHFTGFLPPAQRDRLFALSDLYVMPSVSEPFGITPLEALSLNVPVIVSNQSGIVELFDDIVTVDFWDVKKMSEMIMKLLDDPSSGIPVKKNSSEVSMSASWNDVAHEIKSLYHTLL